jgi:cation diffusion facilitator family transporter
MHSNTEKQISSDARHLKFGMRLSLSVGFFMLIIKIYAFAITGSAAIFSDAAESVVHMFAISFAAFSLWFSMKPADKTHPYGHDRISFFSAGFEGAMIIVAGLYIIYEVVEKWINGLHLNNIAEGTGFILLATVINGALGWYLFRQGKKYHSIVLEANGKHVLTDSWTSLGVTVALILTLWTGWLPFDPIIAIIVAANILWSGAMLVRRSFGGLMDEADPSVHQKLHKILQQESEKHDVRFHHLRHRNAGNKLIIEFHLLFHKDVSISNAHEQATSIERTIMNSISMQTDVTSHLEPIEGHDEAHSDN